MPKGQRLIDWTAENDAKLMLTILAVENVKPNCENVAKAFGGSVNAMAISNRLSRLRRKAAEDGLMPKEGAAAPAQGRKKGGKGGQKGEMVAELSKGSETPAVRTSAKGQKVLTGRVTKARGAGKKDAKSSGKMFDDVDDEAEDNGYDVVAGGSGIENEISEEEEDVRPKIKEEVD